MSQCTIAAAGALRQPACISLHDSGVSGIHLCRSLPAGCFGGDIDRISSRRLPLALSGLNMAAIRLRIFTGTKALGLSRST